MISVPAVADRGATTWFAVTTSAAGSLGGNAASETTVRAAQDALAGMLMVAMDVGLDGFPEDWSGIRLLTLTRKTYPATLLNGN